MFKLETYKISHFEIFIFKNNEDVFWNIVFGAFRSLLSV